MKKPTFFQKMIDNKPRYKIEDLYIGEIVQILNRRYAGQSHPSKSLLGYMLAMRYEYTYKTIKPFAIFKHTYLDKSYLHIVTNHELPIMYNSNDSIYAVNTKNLKKFNGVMQQYMIEHNLKQNSKLSINQIREIEREVNIRINPDRKQDDLFGL